MKGQGKNKGWKGESRRHSLARKGVSTVIDKDRRFNVSNFVAKGLLTEIMDIIDKYEKKDYWGDEELIKMKIAEWEQFGKPEPHTPESIRKELNDTMREDRLNWVIGMVDKIGEKDKTHLEKVLRYDQPFTLEIFTAVTGIKTKGKSNKELNKIIDVYTGDLKASGMPKQRKGESFDGWQERKADKQRESILKARDGIVKGRKTWMLGDKKWKARDIFHEKFLGLLDAYDGRGDFMGQDKPINPNWKEYSITHHDMKYGTMSRDIYRINKDGSIKFLHNQTLGKAI